MSELTDAVICEPLRTPVGRYGGLFRNVPAEQLAATVIRGLLKRTGLDRLLPRCRSLGGCDETLLLEVPSPGVGEGHLIAHLARHTADRLAGRIDRGALPETAHIIIAIGNRKE